MVLDTPFREAFIISQLPAFLSVILHAPVESVLYTRKMYGSLLELAALLAITSAEGVLEDAALELAALELAALELVAFELAALELAAFELTALELDASLLDTSLEDNSEETGSEEESSEDAASLLAALKSTSGAEDAEEASAAVSEEFCTGIRP